MGTPLVLLAEDDPDLRDLIGLLLESDSLRVVAVGDGLDVLTACADERPDLVLLDLTLPGLDGVDVTRAIRAEPHLVEVPILLVTGLGRESGVDDGLAAGADGYLLKPFRPAELSRRVADLLNGVRQ